MNFIDLAAKAQKAALDVFQKGINKIERDDDEKLELKRVLLITNYRTDNEDYTGGIHDAWEEMEDTELSKFAQVLARWQDEIVAEYQGRHMDLDEVPEADSPDIEDNK